MSDVMVRLLPDRVLLVVLSAGLAIGLAGDECDRPQLVLLYLYLYI